MKKMRRNVFLGGCAAAITLGGCARAGATARDYQVLGDDAEPFRATFNAAVGKVRIVVLVSPT